MDKGRLLILAGSEGGRRSPTELWNANSGLLEKEVRVGNRWVDVAGLDFETGERVFAQIGRQTTKGIPVARERRALTDIQNAIVALGINGVPLTSA